jgi:hypothetical protein
MVTYRIPSLLCGRNVDRNERNIILKNAVSSSYLSRLSERAWEIVHVIMQMGINSVV